MIKVLIGFRVSKWEDTSEIFEARTSLGRLRQGGYHSGYGHDSEILSKYLGKSIDLPP